MCWDENGWGKNNTEAEEQCNSQADVTIIGPRTQFKQLRWESSLASDYDKLFLSSCVVFSVSVNNFNPSR